MQFNFFAVDSGEDFEHQIPFDDMRRTISNIDCIEGFRREN